jgi:hypothetical protein
MARTWAMGVSYGDQVKKQEAMREGMIAISGMSPEHIEGARRVLSAQHGDREPTLENGMTASPAIVNHQEYHLMESHVNAHGETVLNAMRSVGGGRYEKIRITQAQADQHTRVVTQVRGDR